MDEFIHYKIKETYNKYSLPFIEVESRDAVDKIIPIVLRKLEEMKNEV